MLQMHPEDGGVTLINVFNVDPQNQQQLVELLTEATETSVSRAPGFLSARLHRSIDGTRVTMYSEWRSIEDYQTMREDHRAPLPLFEAALKIARFEPGVYEVVRAFRAKKPPERLVMRPVDRLGSGALARPERAAIRAA